jgi:hypothetical protein
LIQLPTPWLATSQKFWETLVFVEADSTSRDWFHVYAAAIARCKPNLHAEFKRGELAEILGRRDEDGNWIPMASNRLSNLIADLVQRGLLAQGSGQLCLSLRADAFACTLPGTNQPCQTCAKRISKPRTSVVSKRRNNSETASSTDHKRDCGYAQVRALPIHSENECHSLPQCMEVIA